MTSTLRRRLIALERAPDQPLIYSTLGRIWLDIAAARDDRVAFNKALEALERVGASTSATSEALTVYVPRKPNGRCSRQPSATLPIHRLFSCTRRPPSSRTVRPLRGKR